MVARKMNDLYAVVGDPIGHSKSPLIHRLFAEQTGQALNYEAIRIDIEEESFAYAIKTLIAKGYKGINITVPYKLDAFEQAQMLTERAKIAHAVNTYIFNEDGTITGDNTDGIGLVNDIEINAGIKFKDKKVLILGAGGAVQGILQPLLAKQPQLVHIANRTEKRAVVLAERFDFKISASDWENIPILGGGYDIIINGTSASLDNKLIPVSKQIIGKQSLVYDMMYGDKPTVFMDWAKQINPNCTAMDGLGMLVGQASEAFYLWRNVRPTTAPVIAMVREIMKL
jgi:shikimate dehydrogenase